MEQRRGPATPSAEELADLPAERLEAEIAELAAHIYAATCSRGMVGPATMEPRSITSAGSSSIPSGQLVSESLGRSGRQSPSG